MQPSTRLNQGEFQDTDLLLADNFSRGAWKNNLKQIIYIGGILPKDKKNISNNTNTNKTFNYNTSNFRKNISNCFIITTIYSLFCFQYR